MTFLEFKKLTQIWNASAGLKTWFQTWFENMVRNLSLGSDGIRPGGNPRVMHSLHVARDVGCNVRGMLFSSFDLRDFPFARFLCIFFALFRKISNQA